MFRSYILQVGRLRRLFDTSTRLLELSQSRRLLAVHGEVVARLQTVLDIELPQLTTVSDPHLSASVSGSSLRIECHSV